MRVNHHQIEQLLKMNVGHHSTIGPRCQKQITKTNTNNKMFSN